MADKTIAIIGSGPAGLMVASQILAEKPDSQVHIFERLPSVGRKLLIAGSSGLNVTHEEEPGIFASRYGAAGNFMKPALEAFPPQAWLEFLKSLGMEVFLGTSRRWFTKDMKAAKLLKAWQERLIQQGAQFHPNKNLVSYKKSGDGWLLEFSDQSTFACQKICLACGGGSYVDNAPELLQMLDQNGIKTAAFQPSNTGYHVNWKAEFLKESEGTPLKNISFSSKLGQMRGECVITSYGIEGTPVYTHGTRGIAYLDLFPDYTVERIFEKLSGVKENMAPLRRARKKLKMSETVQSLLFHHLPENAAKDLKVFSETVKHFPIELLEPRPLSESISSRGGILLSELDENLMLRKQPGAYACGELLDWDAPTGGYLIQGCVSTAFVVAKALLKAS